MANNIDKISQINSLMPEHFNVETNPNWKALITALGASDNVIVDLITEVQKQFFIKTAYRPYLDSLAANVGVSRPLGVGMDDTTFKQFIPIMAYTPKQVKLIIDQLLNIFFARETTTAFVESGQAQPFALQDGWELEYTVDEIYDELIYFHTSDFTDINAATTQEIVAAINRQAHHSFAEDFYDNITKNYHVKIFTNTIGSQGSIQLVGGRANTTLQFNGFITGAGSGTNTTWTVTKVGEAVTYQYISGLNPNVNLLQVGDVVISLLPGLTPITGYQGNVGSFVITSINLSAQSFTFTNLFGVPGTYTQTAAYQVAFFVPDKYVVYTQDSRALTWAVVPGEVIVEMPATPPVVKRSLIGSAHINGSESVMTSYNSSSSLTVMDASQFPMAGSFWIQVVDEIITRYYTPTEDTIATSTFNGRLQGTPTKYTYTSRLVLQTTGNTAVGSNQITNVASTVGLAIGQNVFMVGVPSYALITNVIGNVVFIDWPAIAAGIGTTIQFAGDVLTGITPPLPPVAILDENTLTSLVRVGDVVTATTPTPNDYVVGDIVSIYGSTGIPVQISGGVTLTGVDTITGITPVGIIAAGMLITGDFIPPQTYVEGIVGTTVTMTQNATAPSVTETFEFSENLNGTFIITSVSGNTFTFESLGTTGSAIVPGFARVDTIGLAPSGSLIIITDALPSSFTRITGPYVWNLSAPFVLSENIAMLETPIQAGQLIPLLNLSVNTIPSTGGFVVFDYGLNTQEGPVRYLYTPNDTTIVMDPSYIFLFNHTVGSSVTSIDNQGPHIMSGLGTEYPPYITNPGDVRVTLQGLIQSVASSGIFVDFLIRYPVQLYGTIDVYQVPVYPSLT